MVCLIALVGASALLFWWRLLVVMVKSNAGQAFLRRACFFVGAAWRQKSLRRAASLTRQAEWKHTWLGGHRG